MENDEQNGGINDVSLSAAILAPLNALVKAQVHNSRAFLNYLLQLGYKHAKFDDNGNPIDRSIDDLTPFTLPFVNRVEIDGKEVLQKIDIPALALVPSVPLGVESAEFEYDFHVEKCATHEQLQSSRDDNPAKRPWYLVENPVSFHGNVAAGNVDTPGVGGHTVNSASIHIKIKVAQMAVPSGLDKLLTALTQASTSRLVDPTQNKP